MLKHASSNETDYSRINAVSVNTMNQNSVIRQIKFGSIVSDEAIKGTVETNDAIAIVSMGNVSGGGAHSLMLKNDGTVWVWGYNHVGQLGDGTMESKLHPIQVKNLDSTVQIAAGSVHNLVLKKDGTLWGWGYNLNGELGDGTAVQRNYPTQVKDISDVVQISTSGYHSLAIKKDGTVWAWGQNGYGELGDDTMATKLSPVQVKNLSDIVQVSAGLNKSLALRKDGTVYIWGKGYKITPQKVEGLDKVKQVCVGNYGYIMFLKTDGSVWGLNDGQLVKKNGLSNIIAVSGGAFHQVALKNDGTVWSWGTGTEGQLGNGTRSVSDIPVKAKNLTGVAKISAGEFHTIVIKKDGSIWVWGSNQHGQLGNDTTGDSLLPIKLEM